jgi:hypothetical protein
MNTDARTQQAPESYATFWEPLPAVNPPAPSPAASGDAKDAYLEFVNVTEGANGTPARA